MQSVLAGMAMSLAAMGVAAAGLLPAVWGALLQEGIDVAVMLNALRALRAAAGGTRLAAADAALTRRFQGEHEAIRAAIEQLRTVADALGLIAPGAAMTRVRRAHRILVEQIEPHEQAEEAELYPALDRLLGGTEPTATMSRAHAEISHQIRRLGQLIADIGSDDPDDADLADLRSLLYGLHAILRLHTAQEDESYLSLGDDIAATHGRQQTVLSGAGGKRYQAGDHSSQGLPNRPAAGDLPHPKTLVRAQHHIRRWSRWLYRVRPEVRPGGHGPADRPAGSRDLNNNAASAARAACAAVPGSLMRAARPAPAAAEGKMRAAAPGQPRRPLLRQAAKGRRTGRSRGENRDEVAGPPDQVLVGRAGLAGDGGSKTAPWSRCDIQLDPFGIDVELHGSARAGVHQRGRQVRRGSGRAAGVDELACRVLAEGAARHILAAAEGGSPDRPVASGAGGVPAPDQRLQVLPDAEHRFARPGQALVPDADPGGARPADDQARQPAPERADDVALLLVPAGAGRQQEAAVGGGEQPTALTAADARSGADDRQRGGAGILAAALQPVAHRAGEPCQGHDRPVRGAEARNDHLRLRRPPGDVHPGAGPGSRTADGRRYRGVPGRRPGRRAGRQREHGDDPDGPADTAHMVRRGRGRRVR